MIRLVVPDVGDAEIREAVAVLRSGQLVQGERVRTFERAISKETGSRHAIAVSSGTAALHLALLALDVQPGDRVAVPCYSWPATANAVVLCGAEPVFVDIDAATYNMDPAQLQRALAAGPRIKVVMPVHAFGAMADMAAIVELADRFDATVIEDAACALGGALGGRAAGTWSQLGCFSFHPRKIVTTGEGGAVVTDSDELQRRLRGLRNHGIDPELDQVDFVAPGFNYRLTDFQAALGLPQMERLQQTIAARRLLAHRYTTLFAGTGVVPPAPIDPKAHTFQSYVVLLPTGVAAARNVIVAKLRAAGVEASIGTHHIPMTSYFRRRYATNAADFPVAYDVASRSIALPLHPLLTAEEQQYVVQALVSAIGSSEMKAQ